MQRLRSTFTRSRTPTGAEMKSQSSLEVPKQVRSASFDEIQLGRGRSSSSSPFNIQPSLESSAELKSIAKIAMATSSSLSAAANVTTFSTTTAPSSVTFSPSRSLTVADYYPGSTNSATGAVPRKVTSLRVPQFQTGQRSKSFDVAERSTNLFEHHQRSSSSVGTTSSTSPFPGYVARWRSSAERENPPAQAYSCWHCACVDEYQASIRAASNDSLDAEDEADDDDDDASTVDDDEDLEADDELSIHRGGDGSGGGGGGGGGVGVGSGAGGAASSIQLERDAADNSYYFVVVEKTYDDAITAEDDNGSDCSRREGSPEIRVTLTTSSEKTSTDLDADYSLESSVEPTRSELTPECRQRRRSITRQEALTVFPLEIPTIPSLSSEPAGQSSPDEDEDDEDDDDESGRPSNAAGLVVRDIFLTVPDLKRDRAASVDSCFNNNKNGKIETGYSLAVPQQSARSKSVDIVLPTEAQTRYTALLPGSSEARPPFQG